jgi:hypothetical protein
MTRLAAMCVVCPVVDAAVVAGVGHQPVRTMRRWLTAVRIASGECAGRGAGCGMLGLVVQCVCGHEWLWL